MADPNTTDPEAFRRAKKKQAEDREAMKVAPKDLDLSPAEVLGRQVEFSVTRTDDGDWLTATFSIQDGESPTIFHTLAGRPKVRSNLLQLVQSTIERMKPA